MDGAIDLSLAYPERLGSAYAGVSLTSVQMSDGSSPAIDFGPALTGWEGGLLRGGDQVLVTFDGSAALRQLLPSSIDASLQLADGRAFALSVTRSPLAIAVPDVTGTGSLDLTFAWDDGCYDYRAGTSLDVTIVEARIVDSCPTDDAFSASLVEHYDDLVDFGGIPVSFGIDSGGPRYGGGFSFVADGAWPFEFSEATPVLIAPVASLIRIEILDPELLVTEAKASFYSRADILARRLPDTPSFWSRRTSTRGASVLHLQVPTEPGRYALHADFTWGLPCAVGTAQALIAVDVE